MKKIILLGYMGSGKTTIGQILSKKLGMVALDLDKIVEERAQLSVSEIFEQKGEIHFRKLEHDLFLELISNPESMILSLGGGTPCYANNHEMLNGINIVSIYLKATIDTLYERLHTASANRPLIAAMQKEEMKTFIAKNLFDRSFYYYKATHTVAVDDKSPQEVVEAIHQLLA